MQDWKVLSVFIVVLLLLTSGCGKKTTVVLLPDPDGNIGHLTVSNKAGTIDLTGARETTVISGRDSEPATPYELSEERIETEFSLVLSVLPQKPSHFILYFKNESTELIETSQKTLTEIFHSIETEKSQYISVIAHTDTAGDHDYNLQLSHKRAAAVSKILIAEGVPPAYIKSTSHGEENPLIETADNVHEPRNRRVEVVVR